MGVDTKGLIKGHVTPEQIFEFIKENYDKNATSTVKVSMTEPYKKDDDYISEVKVWYRPDKTWEITSGFISFSYGNEFRELFYYYSTINCYSNYNYYKKYAPEVLDAVTTETTSLNLGAQGSATEIIYDIISEFGGGWIDRNDCDDKEYEPVMAINDYVPVYSPAIYNDERYDDLDEER